MNAAEAVITGVVSGILTSAVLFLAARLFNVIVLPWYREIVYRGIDIGGIWENRMELTGAMQTMKINLRQKADQISGTATISKSYGSGGASSEEAFTVNGNVSDRLFSATMRPTDPQRLGLAILLLEVVGDGRKMVGWTSWYDAKAARILGIATEWARVVE